MGDDDTLLLSKKRSRALVSYCVMTDRKDTAKGIKTHIAVKYRRS